MTLNQKDIDLIRIICAVSMLCAGVGMAIAGFCVPPLGSIEDSVLWFAAQCLIWAGAAFGMDIYIDYKLKRFISNTQQQNEKN